MKIQNILFTLCLSFILVLTLVSAIDVNYTVYNATIEDNGAQTNTTVSVTNFNVITYNCTSLNCLTVGTVISSSTSFLNSNVVKIAFPVNLASTYGYVSYFYKDEYIGWAQKSNWAGSGENRSTRSIYLLKKRSGSANITSFNVNNSTGVISAVIDSAIKNTSFATIPLLEQVNTTVNLVITNSSGFVVNSSSQGLMIPYSANQAIQFNYNFSQLPSGNYTVNLSTNVLNEKKILTSILRSNSTIINVFNNISNNQTNSTDNNQSNQTNSSGNIPFINITSPIANGIYNSSVLLNATSNQTIINWFYNLDNNQTSNVTFNLGQIINVSNGSHTITIYGNNSNGTGYASVNFSVNSNLNNNQTNLSSVPVITILSPTNGSNHTTRSIQVNVSSDQNISNWYSLYMVGPWRTFVPNTSLNFSDGWNTLRIYGENANGSIGFSEVIFYINSTQNNNQTNQTDNDDEDNNDEDSDDNSNRDLRNINLNNTIHSEEGVKVIYLGNSTRTQEDFDNDSKFSLLGFSWLMFLVFLILGILILIVLLFKHS